MRKFLMLFLLVSFPLFCEWNLTVCTIFQNDARFLAEWISYHEKEGVDHFLLYNNMSTDNYQEVLAPFVARGLVEVIEWPSVAKEDEWENFCFHTCISAYNDGIQRLKGKTKWLAIIDTDEFIFSIDKPLKALLKKYKKQQAIGLLWACYGTSNVDYCAPGEMLKKLLWRLPLDHPRNSWWKSIMKMKEIIKCAQPHGCLLKDKGFEMVLDRAEARINHYWSRDETFLHEVKIPRYLRWKASAEGIIEEVATYNQEYDDAILNR